MQEFIEKLIGMLEELYARNDKTKKMAYEEKDWEKFDLFTHRCEGIYSAISIVNQLAEEYKGTISKTENVGWIPCSERLPKENGYYYVTQIVKSVSTGKKIAIEKAYVEFSKGEWRRAKHLEVIAWLDIEPYQPKGE